MMAPSGSSPTDPPANNAQEPQVSPVPNGGPYLPAVIAASSGTGGGAPARPSSTLNVFTLLAALRRRWALALGLGTVGAAVAAAVMWCVLPSTYTVRSLVHVLAYKPKILGYPDNSNDFNNYQRAQVALLKSRLVINSALRDSKVAELPVVREQVDPIAWLEKELRVDFSIAPEILSIQMNGKDPQQLIVVINALRENYLTEIANKERTQRLAHLEKLQKIAAEREDYLKNKRRGLKEMAEGVGTKDAQTLALKHQYAMTELHALETDLLALRKDIRTTQLLLKAEQAREGGEGDNTVSNDVIEEAMSKDGLVATYRAKIAQLEANVELYKQKALDPEKVPTFKKNVDGLAEAKKELAARQQMLRAQLTEYFQEKMRQGAKERVAQLQQRLELLKTMEKTLNDEIATRTGQLQGLSKTTIDLEWLKDEIAQIEGMAKTVGSQAAALEVEIQAPERISRLEEAVITQTPDLTKTLRTMGMAAVAVFALIVFGISWWEIQARKVSTTEEVVQGLGMKLVGSLPVMPARASRQPGRLNNARELHWHNLLVESVDAARTNLLHMARLEGLRIVMITSASGGEGKTLLSTHLAASLVRAGCRTLLIDGDLRSPAIHRLLNLPAGPGFAEVLRDELTVDEVTQPGPVEGLTVIPAGECDAETLRALAHGNLTPLFQQLKGQYDFIVVDSAPVLPVADSLLLGQYVDGVLFSILRDVSRLPSVQAAQERLAMLDIRLLGAVVNGVPTTYSKYASRYTMAAMGKAEVEVETETESPA